MPNIISIDTYHKKNNEFNRENNIKKQKSDNYKKILCKNINIHGKCIYNNKCLYAHSIEDQKIDSIRVEAYNMIKNDDNLSYIDLSSNKYLYNNLQILCKLCKSCNDGICTGGYNCKHGAYNKKYVICHVDLNKGICPGCDKIHLTSKGLIPYGKRIIENMKTKINIPKAIILNDDYFKNLNIDNNSSNNSTINSTDDEISMSSNESESSNNSKKYEYIFDRTCDDINFNNLSNNEEKLTRPLFIIEY